jgi:predicted PhzF superfamily epimerase YddE/YHI9
MTIPILQVDAFTERPFAGNPAAVCLLDKEKDDAWLQSVAAEMNLSETAFLLKVDDSYRLRWFTPKVEVDLCGHATLASAHVLWTEDHVAPDAELRFHSNSGLLNACRDGETIELDFPSAPLKEVEPPPGLLESLGVAAEYVGQSQFDYLVEVETEDQLCRISPDFVQLKLLEIRGVIVTSRSSSPEYDFVSRFFAPAAGIDEDPVTGSAHCCLGPYWQQRLGKDRFVAYQASVRGGTVQVRVAGERTYLGGRAVTVLRGELAE